MRETEPLDGGAHWRRERDESVPARDIVVIGASAGGLEGLTRIFRDLPADLPAAIFVVMHVSPTAESRLAAILAKAGKLPAATVNERDRIRHGQVYVAAPDSHLIVDDGEVFASRAPRENRNRPSVDALFRSAAISYGARTIGVILSGTLDDGTAGLRWVKRSGGCAIVQDPADAQFRGMPSSAIAHVDVDRVLPAEHIAEGIVELIRGDGSPKEEIIDPKTPVDAQGAPVEYGEAKPSAFVCPDCGGTLFEMGDGDLTRFRCRVGHAYSPEALHGEQERTLEEALWMAIRSLEEHAALADRLERWARGSNLNRAAARFASNAEDARAKATVVRRAVREPIREIEQLPN